MPVSDSPQPPSSKAHDAALAVVRTLRENGQEAYFAGGCVRDLLLGGVPEDFDVATDATPDRVQALFRKTQAVGAAFGVVLVHQKFSKERVSTEVATFRTDGTYTDGRRPDSVVFATAREDACRRDFTCNGLFQDPLHGAPGGADHPEADAEGVIDFVGGRTDLEAGVLRAIGAPAERFAEDHLRLLRLVRFAARLGFGIDPATAAAARAVADRVAAVAPERVGEELRRILTSPPPAAARGAALLADLGLAEPVLGAGDPAGVQALAALGPAPHATALAALALDRHADPAAAETVVRKRWASALCLPNAVNEDAAAALRGLQTLGSWHTLGVAERKRTASAPGFGSGSLALLRSVQPSAASRIEKDVQALAADGIGLAPPPLVDGRALIDAGLRPGPAFRGLLARAYDAQLEGRVSDAGEALTYSLRGDAPPPDKLNP